MSRSFESLSPLEVLALAVNVEQANARRFRAFADVFQGYDAAVAARFQELAVEEDEHESLLTAQFRKRFGDVIPVVEEVEVEGVIESVDVDDAEHLIFASLEPTRVYELALRAERGAQEFYKRAMAESTDEALSTLYRELAEMEDDHAAWLETKLRTLDSAVKDRGDQDSSDTGMNPTGKVTKFNKFPHNKQFQEGTDYLFCAVCRVHVACRRLESGGWEVQCENCIGECAFCQCSMKSFCFGSREEFPPFPQEKSR